MIITKENIASLILNPEKKFLLIQRAPKDDSLPGFWELPSGGIDEGEDMETSVIREVKEESGIDISNENLKLVDSESYSFTKENGDIKNVTETTYLVSLDNTPEVILSDEHVNYQWVSLLELEDVFEDKEDLIYKRVNRIFKQENL
ncbi:MAG: NUDIX domain-containing protein [Candidatus Dojkabacteria bacterium]|nr:NUDIX domain-containing protein [Candidatus Dojkabacteria bacterium]